MNIFFFLWKCSFGIITTARGWGDLLGHLGSSTLSSSSSTWTLDEVYFMFCVDKLNSYTKNSEMFCVESFPKSIRAIENMTVSDMIS